MLGIESGPLEEESVLPTAESLLRAPHHVSLFQTSVLCELYLFMGYTLVSTIPNAFESKNVSAHVSKQTPRWVSAIFFLSMLNNNPIVPSHGQHGLSYPGSLENHT